jgi:hypothetical protein
VTARRRFVLRRLVGSLKANIGQPKDRIALPIFFSLSKEALSHQVVEHVERQLKSAPVIEARPSFYARVSTADQNLDLQRDALKKAG